MRIILCLLLASTTLSCLAQDLDFPDYRSKKDNFSKIREQDIRSDVASFALAGVDESIGKAQLKSLPVKDYGQNFMSYEGPGIGPGNPPTTGENIQVTIRTGSFIPTKHKLMYSEKHLLRIDNKPYYGGIYGEPPHTTIEAVTVVVGKDTVAIPATAFFDLYDPKFSFNQSGATRTRNGVFLSNDKHTFYIYMLNIDNGGAEYTFVIRDKQYLRRIVDIGFLPK
ncbi:MAG TPA: hypothetical protein VGM30_13895 [Puia sp.]|jgi:hypothetical protein